MDFAEFKVEKFTGKMISAYVRAFLVLQGIEKALAGEAKLPNSLSTIEKKDMLDKAHSTLILSLADKVLREVSKEKTAAAVWHKLENLYMTKSLATRLHLKQKLYTIKMPLGKSLEDHLDDFNKIILDLENIKIKVDDEDKAFFLLRSLPREYDSLWNTLIYGRDSLSLKEVQNALFSKELKRKSKGNGPCSKIKPGARSKATEGEKGRCFICKSESHFKKDCPLYTRRGSEPRKDWH